MHMLEALLWGTLQGLTEFLPVSSSGHLVLVPWLLGRGPSSFTFDVLVHLATLLAVLIYFRRELVVLLRGAWHLVRHRRLATPEARLAWLIALSALPAALVGILFRELLERLFGAPPAAAGLLLVTGAAMYLAERHVARNREMPALSARDALAIGLAQAAALAPGISRSGATISAGLGLGMRRDEAARFSFLMAIPVVLGVTALEVLDLLGGALPPEAPLALATGFAAAFLSGFAAIALLLRHLQRRSLRPFAYYCWAMGLLSLAVYLLR